MEIPHVFELSCFVFQYLCDELLGPVKATGSVSVKAVQNSRVEERKSNLALL